MLILSWTQDRPLRDSKREMSKFRSEVSTYNKLRIHKVSIQLPPFSWVKTVSTEINKALVT